MSDQHIKDLEIRNFKCFKQLSIANIGQVNLIGGKNNVGKTAFLEAVEIFVSSNEIYDLVKSITNMLIKRQNKTDSLELDFINDIKQDTEILSCDKSLKIKFSNEFLTVSINKNKKCNEAYIPIYVFIKKPIPTMLMHDTQGFLIGTQQFPIENITYITSSKANEEDIAILYGKLIDLGRDDFLNNSLSIFDKNIVAIKFIPTKNNVTLLKLKLKNQDSLILLSSLGEGINRYIAILCAIWASKDGILLIDEIENGIHYTNYKKLWQIIFKASVEANCQIFITSHSKECITAFNDVQFEDKQCNAQYFELYKNLKTDLITATARDKEQLRYELNNEGRVRGE